MKVITEQAEGFWWDKAPIQDPFAPEKKINSSRLSK